MGLPSACAKWIHLQQVPFEQMVPKLTTAPKKASEKA